MTTMELLHLMPMETILLLAGYTIGTFAAIIWILLKLD